MRVCSGTRVPDENPPAGRAKPSARGRRRSGRDVPRHRRRRRPTGTPGCAPFEAAFRRPVMRPIHRSCGPPGSRATHGHRWPARPGLCSWSSVLLSTGARPVSAPCRSTTLTSWPASCSAAASLSQHHGPCHEPCTSTIAGRFCAVAAQPPSAPRAVAAAMAVSDFLRVIFMSPRLPSCVSILGGEGVSLVPIALTTSLASVILAVKPFCQVERQQRRRQA